MTSTEELIAHINDQHKKVVAHFDSNKQNLDQIQNRLNGLERVVAEGLVAPRGATRSRGWGSLVTTDPAFKNFVGQMGTRGTAKIKITNEISTASGTDTIVAPDRQKEIVGLPMRRLTVRDLLAPGNTNSNLVEYVRLVSRHDNAAPVADGQQKPESGLTFEVAEAPVRTIAHWIPVTRQAMDDVSQLQSLIDSELRYGLAFEEENQLLAGDGTGQNLLGLIPQATPYDAPFSVEDAQALDILLLAIAQAEASNIPCDGIIVNSLDWRKMQALKDNQGRYLGAGPFGVAPALAWQIPVVATPSLAPGEFLVGGFKAAAQILDRMEVEVLISSEDRDNFIKNMLTVRCEERLALAVKRPQALVYGEYPSGI